MRIYICWNCKAEQEWFKMSIDPRNFDTFVLALRASVRDTMLEKPSKSCGCELNLMVLYDLEHVSVVWQSWRAIRRQLHPKVQSVAKLKSWKLIRCTDKSRRKESDVCASRVHGSLGSNSCISFDSCALEFYNLCKSARLAAWAWSLGCRCVFPWSEKCGMLEAMFGYKCSRLGCRNELCHRHLGPNHVQTPTWPSFVR